MSLPAGSTETDLDCGGSWSCVSSRASASRAIVPALTHSHEPAKALERLAGIVRSLPGGDVVELGAERLTATFTSRWLGFVDDVVFVVRDGTTIDVRSASRVGRYDFGVNRARVERIRELFEGDDAG